MSRGAADLVCHGAGHQAAPFSTGRPEALQRISLEDSSGSAEVPSTDPSLCALSARSVSSEQRARPAAHDSWCIVSIQGQVS